MFFQEGCRWKKYVFTNRREVDIIEFFPRLIFLLFLFSCYEGLI